MNKKTISNIAVDKRQMQITITIFKMFKIRHFFSKNFLKISEQEKWIIEKDEVKRKKKKNVLK